MSGCADVQAQAEALAVGLVPDDVAAALLDHAAGCAECAALVEAEQAVEARLNAALRPAVPEGLEAMIHRGLADAAPTAPTAPRRRTPWMWIAAAAMLLLGVMALWPRGGSSASSIDGDVRLGGDPLTASAAAVSVGDRLETTTGRATLRHAGATFWLEPETAISVEADGVRLHAGAIAVNAGRDIYIDTAHGRITSSAGVFDARIVSREDLMTKRDITVFVGGVAAAGAVFIAAQFGALDISNDAGETTIAGGERAVATGEAAPRAVTRSMDRAEIEARMAGLRQMRDDQQAQIERLQAQVAKLKAAAGDGADEDETPTLRPIAEVRTDLSALMKEQGMQILGIGKDHDLLRELAAMGPAGVELLGEMLQTGDDQERFGAAALMELLGDAAAIPALEDAIFNETNADNVLVRRMASHAVARIGGEKAVASLERIVEEGGEWGVRTNAAHGLAEMGRESGIDWLLDSFRTQKDPTARVALLGAMGQIGDPKYLPELHGVLQNETEYTQRYLAMTGIAKAARDESLPILEAIMNNPDEDKMIVAEARKAYDEIKGD